MAEFIKLIHFFIIVMTVMAILFLFSGVGNHNYPIIKPNATAEAEDPVQWPWLYNRETPSFRFADIYGKDLKSIPSQAPVALVRRTCQFYSSLADPDPLLVDAEMRQRESFPAEIFRRATDPLNNDHSPQPAFLPIDFDDTYLNDSAFPTPYDLHKTIFALKTGIALYEDCRPVKVPKTREFETQVDENMKAATASFNWIKKWDEFQFEDAPESTDGYIVQPSANIFLLYYHDCPGDERCSAGWAIMFALFACILVILLALISCISIHKGLEQKGAGGGCWRRTRTRHGITWDAFRVAIAIFFSLIGSTFAFIFGMRFYVLAWMCAGVLMALVVILWMWDIYTVHHMLLWTDKLDDTGLCPKPDAGGGAEKKPEELQLEPGGKGFGQNVAQNVDKHLDNHLAAAMPDHTDHLLQLTDPTQPQPDPESEPEPAPPPPPKSEPEPEKLKDSEKEHTNKAPVGKKTEEKPKEAGEQEEAVGDIDIQPINVEKIVTQNKK